jgi:putative serine protease PepD
VHEQTRRLRLTVIASVVVLGALAVGAYWVGHHEAAAPVAIPKQDPTVAGVMGMPAVRDANDAAIVFITTDLTGKSYEATGFSVSPAGLIVTNRHVVDDGGTKASKILVTFANTKTRLPAHVVALHSDVGVDLALIQVDAPATYPVVRGIAPTVDTPVGGAIATLGFPLGTDVQMEGSGGDLVVKTSLTMGTVSKSVPGTLLQIDSFAAHGSSGSPVFDAHGHVIGVVWGGPKNAAGRIVYAVPAERIIELVNSAGGGGAT